MEVAESIYEDEEAYSQTKQPSSDKNWSSFHQTQGGWSELPTGSVKSRDIKRRNKYGDWLKSKKPDAPPCIIHGDGPSYGEFKVLRDYGDKHKFQTARLGGKTTINKRVKFSKTGVNGENLNSMVKRFIMTALKKGGDKRTCRVVEYIDISRDEDEDFFINHIDWSDLEW